MRFEIKKIGRIDEADLFIRDLTVICGPNNTGKTYATYALYGLLKMWEQNTSLLHSLAGKIASVLPSMGVYRIDLESQLLPTSNAYFAEWAKIYSRHLPDVFASSPDFFKESSIHFEPDQIQLDISEEFKRSVKLGSNDSLIFSKEKNSSQLDITLPIKSENNVPEYAVASIINGVFRELVWNQIMPKVFISSTERTGAALFSRSLNFTRDKALDTIKQLENESKHHDISALMKQLQMNRRSDYPLAVEDNVRLMGNLESMAKVKGYIAEHHPEIIEAFDEIVGGSYKSTKEGVHYVPKGSKNKLTMAGSSSIVRSLLDVSFYLRHELKPGDLLIMDEPELSLHPGNQRLLARLLARLVNIGVRVLVTTHSDYIIRELNVLIVMKSLGDSGKSLVAEHKYEDDELLDAEKVSVYVAEEKKIQGSRKSLQTLARKEVNPCEGMAIESFDKEIQSLNVLQMALIDAICEKEVENVD